MMYFSLKYIFLLIIIANECVSKTINQDNLELKFVFIVSTTILPKYTRIILVLYESYSRIGVYNLHFT